MRNESVKWDKTFTVLHFWRFGLEIILKEMVNNSENFPLLHYIMSQTFQIYRNTNDYVFNCCSPLLGSPPVVLI